MASESTPFILRDGICLAGSEPALSLFDGAIQQGHGLFETLAVYEGKPFAVEAHWSRLEAGATALGLEVPAPDLAIEGCRKLIDANGLGEEAKLRLRITVTPGNASQTSHWFLQVARIGDTPKSAAAITVPFSRNEGSALAGFKTINYGENVVAMRQAREAGADEAIFGNSRGMICEGTWSNLFLRIDGTWRTPPLRSGCLPGVTREIILTLAQQSSTEVIEAEVPMEELKSVEAAFFSSSIRELQPIHVIDGRPLPNPLPPEVGEWQNLYSKHIQQFLSGS